MSHKMKNGKRSYVLKAEAGKYSLVLQPIAFILEKIRIQRNRKNVVFSIIGIIVCSLIGFMLGGIIGTIVGFSISVILLFIIGPTKVKIIERNRVVSTDVRIFGAIVSLSLVKPPEPSAREACP